MPKRLAPNLPALSSRAQRRICFFFTSLLCLLVSVSNAAPKRPRIIGIASVDMYATHPRDTREFYRMVLGVHGPCHWCEEVSPPPMIVPVNNDQFVMLWSAPTPLSNYLTQITFRTNDLAGMKKFLAAKEIKYFAPPGVSEITVEDPEGHTIGFTQEHTRPNLPQVYSTLHIIHAGFVVHDRAATDHFYKDILGFRPYWHGGMKDDKDDWVAMQVPDGTDWIEYMLNVSADADKRTRGVMNHISLGVPDIRAAEKQLREDGLQQFDGPEIGRDGKWALDTYDPDGTRIEFMEFTPVQKPCCSEFTGPHPKP